MTTPTTRRSVIALRTVRRSDTSVLVRVPRSPALVVEGIGASALRLLVGLGASSTLHLRSLASGPIDPATAAVLHRLAEAAERTAGRTTALPHLVLDGAGSLTTALGAVLTPYARLLTGPVDAQSLLADSSAAAPSLAVLVTAEALDLDACSRWRSRGVPVLPVLVRGDRVIVGPLLEPAQAPCATCVELHRCDRDPRRAQWLSALGPALLETEHLDVEPAEIALTAGVVATLVRCRAEGIALPTALSITLSRPYPDLRHHEWAAHPRCGCWTMES